jgi:hypothetical protein
LVIINFEAKNSVFPFTALNFASAQQYDQKRIYALKSGRLAKKGVAIKIRVSSVGI